MRDAQCPASPPPCARPPARRPRAAHRRASAFPTTPRRRTRRRTTDVGRELSFEVGDVIIVTALGAAGSEDWWSGCHERDPPAAKSRLFPSNYIEVIERHGGSEADHRLSEEI